MDASTRRFLPELGPRFRVRPFFCLGRVDIRHSGVVGRAIPRALVRDSRLCRPLIEPGGNVFHRIAVECPVKLSGDVADMRRRESIPQ